ncbi:cation-translocating P-type ATPase [Subdoligranulum variabile]|uniref:P-type Ca(2+) transporter n=1 Tax=Subdoligranulum variabile DSM 15176 TaxID=411471 RepID=D1PJQ6_9FIRM|nr:cation-translocating P-type ATPase [Subdoligranulum variabile]EFB77004.1 putative potassium/sodium efflux P-type ATPase, fungal-type [Subdoligranulum variabile DSM 15176]UWP67670.1 cation-translocating P-type ATPase [Subdoligranulum variabile]
MKQAYTQSVAELLRQLDASEQGLSTQQAEARLQQYGPNKLRGVPKPTLMQRFAAQLKDPMLLILLAAAVVSGVTDFLAGENFAEAAIILIVVLLNAVLGVVQESKAEAAIEALQTMTAATCKVLRDGHQRVLHSEELVPGDVVVLEAGDSVPADGRLLESASLKIEEAALTGESVPVTKAVQLLGLAPGQGEVPLADRKNMCYMGSTVVYGRGRAVITATGMQTEMGKIAGALSGTGEEQTPLQRRLDELGRTLSKLVLAICVFIFVFDLVVAGSFTLQSVLSTFMVAVSLAVAAIPEGLATVVTVVLSIGVTNMSRRKAVIRRLTAVETLGCTQVICTDKTGTLTQNRMTVVEHQGDIVPLATAMALCSDAALNDDGRAEGEPTEAALVDFAAAEGLPKDRLEAAQPRVGEAPFDSGRKMMSTIHRGADGFIQYTKGAPDVVLDRCTAYRENGTVYTMTPEKRREFLEKNKAMADRALRVLAAAERHWGQKPASEAPEMLEQDLCFLGLTGMIDPVRPEVMDAIAECRRAGIRPVMITGDHKDTAVAIARQLQILDDASQAVTGAELDTLSDEELAQAVTCYTVYARVQPEHKTRIVAAWRRRGAVTAMSGDGVNDAPSLKMADIGIGMGVTGTDVTKNVADMVLADDNFATIVAAVEEGRRIYDNIRKSIQFLLASNMSEVLGVFGATLLGFTLLNPVHLLFINLITDCFPALALGMEPGEPDTMSRPPRRTSDGIFAGGLGTDIAYQGVLIAGITMLSYILGHCIEAGALEMPRDVSPDGMTMAFLTMSMCEIFHSFNLRSQRKSVFSLHTHNFMLWGAMLGSLLLTTAVLEIPVLARMFGFTPVSLPEYLLALALAVLVIPIVELVKWIQRRRAA